MQQNDQQQPTREQPGKAALWKNLALVGGVVILAVGLMLVARSQRSAPVDPARLAVSSPLPQSSAQPAARPTQAPLSGDVKAVVLISVGGRPYAVEPLNEERDVEVEQEHGEKNVVHLTPNGFYMHSSTCDNQLCISQGEVTMDNYTRRILGPYVLCLPNQVELELIVLGATPPPDMPDI